MAEAKTKPTSANVLAYIDARGNEQQRSDCAALMTMMKRVTGEPPMMWGPSIVGFGSYHYRYASGHEGDACLTGFAIRANDLVVYLMGDDAKQTPLLAKLGKHKMGKACLYFKRLADLDTKVLETLIKGSVADLKRRHG